MPWTKLARTFFSCEDFYSGRQKMYVSFCESSQQYKNLYVCVRVYVCVVSVDHTCMICVCVVSVDHTCMICVPFLKLVNDLMTSWLMSSIAFFQSLLKPRTSCVTFPDTDTVASQLLIGELPKLCVKIRPDS